MPASQRAARGGRKRVPADGRCAICGGPRGRERRGPFCSPRCQLVDLQRWLDGGYRIPIDEHNSPGDPFRSTYPED